MFRIIVSIVIVVIAGILLFAATKPAAFRIERSIVIDAAPEKIYALITDFHAWRQWSPWENIDPDLKRDYSGPVSGKGAAYVWEGNKDVGSGRMEIIETTPPSKIGIQLDFLKPFASSNKAEFDLQPDGHATRVTWIMKGPTPYVQKLMGIFFDMDKMIGGNFETGLKNMKALAERPE